MQVPCHKGGHQCSWPACSLDCTGRHPKPLPTQAEADEYDADACSCDTAIEDILTGRVDCYVCGNFWYR